MSKSTKKSLNKKTQSIIGKSTDSEIASGGGHTHWIIESKKFTCDDGWHGHYFLISGKLLSTNFGGTHRHPIIDNKIIQPLMGHYHELETNEQLFLTEIGGGHTHEVEASMISSNEPIPMTGEHRHFIKIDGVTYESITSNDVLSVEIRKALALDIQSIMFKKSIFATFEKAAQKAEQLGLSLKKFEERQDAFVFTQLDASNFKDLTLQVIELEAGITAIIGLLKDVEDPKTGDIQPSSLTQNPDEQEELEELEDEVETADKLTAAISLGYVILSKEQALQFKNIVPEVGKNVLALKSTLAIAAENIMTFCDQLIEKSEENHALASLCDRTIQAVDLLSQEMSKIEIPELAIKIEKELQEEMSILTPEGVATTIAIIQKFCSTLETVFQDTSFENLHLLFKSADLTLRKFLKEVVGIEKALIPTDEMTRQDLRDSQQERSDKFGIEVVSGSALTFPSGFPTSLNEYGDPVNLKFPFDTKERAANARVRFKQFADQIYKEEKSKAIVHERIVRQEINMGITPVLDKNDALDALLPKSLFNSKKVQLVDEIKKQFEKHIFIPLRKEAKEEKTVFGIVLEPDVVDLHGDTYDEDTVKNAAHFFMENFQNIGLQHGKMVNDKVKILESFLAPVDMEIDTPKGTVKIKKNTWLMKVRIVDEELWQDVKQGKFKGFSIGGVATVNSME